MNPQESLPPIRVELPGGASRVRFDLAYDGTNFSGWAHQPGLRTVQGVFEDALAKLLRNNGVAPRLTVAGRTDSGVHAIGQVAHLDVGSGVEIARLTQRLNGYFREGDLRVVSTRRAPRGFDARFSALWRLYEYRIADATSVVDPRERAYTLWYSGTLDVAAMNETAKMLLGLHDFAAFCRARAGATTIRTLQEFVWVRGADGVLRARVRADAFCHSMVRSLVGACVAVGRGRLAPETIAEILMGKRRSSEFAVLPALGLTLTQVGYPVDAQLAARVEKTRARRDQAGGTHVTVEEYE